MKNFRIIGLAIIAVLLCLSACSGGGDDPIEPTPKPEVIKPEITIDSSIITNGLNFTNEKGEQSISFTANENWTLSIAETRSGVAWITPSATSGNKGNATIKFTILENTTYDSRSVAVTIKAGTASKTFTITQKHAEALLVSTNKYELEKEGGDIQIEVKSNINYQMEISETAKSWISESSGRGLTSYKHTLKVTANENAEKREGEIYFKSGDKTETVKVYQMAAESVLLLSQNEYNVSQEGSTISVDVKSNVEYGVKMPDVDWITDDDSNRNMSSHTLKYLISANETYDNRSAEIVFYDKNSDLKNTLKITQVQKDAIVISKKEYDAKPEGETIEVELNSNVDFDISIEHDWITQVESKSSRGLVSHKLYFQVAENATDEERSSKITIKDKNKQITEAITIKQKNKEKEIPYLTFSAEGKQTLTMSKAVETLEYSVNGGEWKELGTNTVEFGGEMGDLRLRGMSAIGTTDDFNNYSTVIFGTNVLVTSRGDINSLVDYKNIDIVNTEQARFCGLFLNCNVLTTAPKLSATTLDYFCYKEMFKGCTNLVDAPKLPATTLADYCYWSMFDGCTNLVNAPELPATALDDCCYFYMFNGCTSLVDAPQPPAKTLSESSYAGMFYGCTSLVNAPKLPATTLAKSCYSSMFGYCTSLVNAPQLPASTLKDNCYASMFYGCTSLVNAPKSLGTTLADYCCWLMFRDCTSLVNAPQLPATALKTNCYTFMFAGCTSLVDAPELIADNLANNCYKGMFEGCTSLIKAPELPAKKLVNECYFGMFENCTNLEEAPQLPALVLADKCYAGMFNKCTSLTSTPQLPATTLAKSCYNGMFSGCTNLTIVSKLIATTLADYCYAGMFDSCINLIKAPDLPATTLKEFCYGYMFYGCTNLKEAPQLPALDLALGCYNDMFNGCSSLTTPPDLPALQLADRCYESMFNGCTSLTTAPILPAPQLTSSCYAGMFYGCTNLNNVTFLATELGDDNNWGFWMRGVSSTGTFIKAKEMETSILQEAGVIPNGWTIKDQEKEDSSANGNMENPNESNSSEW